MDRQKGRKKIKAIMKSKYKLNCIRAKKENLLKNKTDEKMADLGC